ncbi:hypothetical protein EUTSA_v10000634mg, partial [Eutrema salsugineum]
LFRIVLGVVLFILNIVCIDNSTSFGKCIDTVSSISDSPEVCINYIAMLMLILIFATVHSGLASLRDIGDKLILILYPSTYNLLEVAAVDKPKMHLWDTDIMRITRHPQVLKHFLITASASLGLIAQHLFGAWNEDMRLGKRYGEAFEGIKKRTSVVPFAAIFEGRQVLLEDYYKKCM